MRPTRLSTAPPDAAYTMRGEWGVRDVRRVGGWWLQEHDKRCWSVHFNRADVRLLASGSDDSRVKLWSLNTERSVATLEAKVTPHAITNHIPNVLQIKFKTACTLPPTSTLTGQIRTIRIITLSLELNKWCFTVPALALVYLSRDAF